MNVWRALSLLFQDFRRWAQDHGGEVLWAVIFAVLVGLPLAIFFAYYVSPKNPYKVYVVAGHHFLTRSGDLSKDTIAGFSAAFPKKEISGVNVDLAIEELTDDDPKTAESKARDLINKDDALLVVGHMDSEPTEVSLHIYLDTTPQVPFIASVQSDDNLIDKACKADQSGGVPAFRCFDGLNPLPYLQLSPTNLEEARWAIRFATEHKKHKFLIVEDDSFNKSYAANLADDYGKAISEYNKWASGSNNVSENQPPTPILTGGLARLETLTDEMLWEKFKNDDFDCLLYAGGFDGADTLLKQIAVLKNDKAKTKNKKLSLFDAENDTADSSRALMVILDDSVVDERYPTADFTVSPINVADQVDALDYTNGKSVYGLDAIAIAAELIDDLNKSKPDWELRLKTFLHLQTTKDVRRNLVRVMQDNFRHRSSYFGVQQTGLEPAPRAVYAFDGYTRANGIFHVWERVKSGTAYENDDIDRWHPLREVPYMTVRTRSNPQIKLAAKKTIEKQTLRSH
ncbi:MAG TPA: ABC transporter substrate-binding protein [Terriglobales bacterium]